MQAYEFRTTTNNGLIRIPDEYVKKVGSDIRVILIADEHPKHREKALHRSLGDLIGALESVGDVSLAEIRSERLRKYENPD